jgi:hypothetical protein
MVFDGETRIYGSIAFGAPLYCRPTGKMSEASSSAECFREIAAKDWMFPGAIGSERLSMRTLERWCSLAPQNSIMNKTVKESLLDWTEFATERVLCITISLGERARVASV